MPGTILVDTDVFSYLWQARPEAQRFRRIVEGAVLALVTNNRNHFEQVPDLELLPENASW